MIVVMFNRIKSCDLCGNEVSVNGHVLASGVFDRYGIRLTTHIMLCRYCKYIFQYERFNHKTLSFLYEQDTPPLPTMNSCDSEIYQDNLKKRQAFISKAISMASLDGEKNLKILDVGGGDGEVTVHLLDQGKVYLADVSTRDPVDPGIVKVDRLFDKAYFSEKFDVIVMNHVLEHVFSPTDFLVRANSLLTERGVVIVEVPFELYTPLLGRVGDWKHVAYFSTSVLRNFLQKAEFTPLYINLCTGYYGTRKLAVIRAVARKMPDLTNPTNCKSGYLKLLADCVNVRTLLPYLSAQYRKLFP